MKEIVIDAAALPKLNVPAYQLAIDEAALSMAEVGEIGTTFRTWELSSPTVILGRSSKIELETDREFCRRRGIGIYRRCSGGAAIVAGPGCLMYNVIVSLDEHPEASKIDRAHQLVMSRVLEAVKKQLPAARKQGICDLTEGDRKFSGNALRISRRHLLYHGTLLYDVDLEVLQRCLAFAPRQPDYRDGRDHGAFVTNVPLDPTLLRKDLAGEFGVDGQIDARDLIPAADKLIEQRYGREAWHTRH
ncbi:lipoate--protein ligase family protein [Roseiconus lacunae]|uniref:lipoate--protein ligase family protein n=1 Tax=Roseiconus lacunae TaxID=2605694 RepID=UPI001E5C22A9|nr:lipoate--protein ligase family protein [Roseiconus lacunae]MCD0461950.1 lipoate--protein ligase family protein [Roseiconus lacunae]